MVAIIYCLTKLEDRLSLYHSVTKSMMQLVFKQV